MIEGKTILKSKLDRTVDGTSSQIHTLPKSRVPMGGAKRSAVAHLIHVSISHTKFGLISSSDLDGDSIMDRQR